MIECLKYYEMFDIVSFLFHVDVNRFLENLQMELIDLQCTNNIKRIFVSALKMNFYNIYITPERHSNLRYFSLQVIITFGPTYVCEAFFIPKMKFAKSFFRASLTDASLER